MTDELTIKPPIITLAFVLLVSSGGLCRAEDRVIQTFETRQLSDVYFSEGASAGDINGDGQVDVVCGPYWYEGPNFSTKHEIYQPVPQNRDRYADNFFSWVYDFDSDGNNDVFVVGFPGTPAYVYQNPGRQNDEHWKKHQVIDWVSNESPQFTNLVGDPRPELVCTRDGFFGFATIDWADPLGEWEFHPVSQQTAPKKFGHGLGIGDINGDGKQDIIFSSGWYQQPDTNPDQGRWKLHTTSFSNSYGGAEMHAYDIDGDGDNDVITSHAAHDFGLGWYEQIGSGDQIEFKHHLIMGDRPEDNRYGVVFSEPHSVNLADIDGDGLKDIISGKTYFSHHRQSPMWDADAVVYWFRLQRTPSGIDWVPYRAGSTSGIGRQVCIHDLNQDNLPDIVVGGMKGTHVLIQSRKKVNEAEWKSAQPQPYVVTGERTDRGQPAVLGDDGTVAGAIEGETMKVTDVSTGSVSVQEMSNFKGAKWSGGKQLFWREAKPRARLKLTFDVQNEGDYEISAVLTTAGDYAIVNLLLDRTALGNPIDLYEYPGVGTTGVLPLGTRTLKAGQHELTLETIGANDSAKKSYMVGLDYLRLEPK
jgi:hypothetical protein